MKQFLCLALALVSLTASGQGANSTEGQINQLKNSKLNITDYNTNRSSDQSAIAQAQATANAALPIGTYNTNRSTDQAATATAQSTANSALSIANAAVPASAYNANRTTDQQILTNGLATKQNTLTFDSSPTTGSSNPPTSGGVKAALDLKADAATVYTRTEVDNKISAIAQRFVDNRTQMLSISPVANTLVKIFVTSDSKYSNGPTEYSLMPNGTRYLSSFLITSDN